MRAGESAGDLAIVLHSHMPYVEGFGTYPFGEEWLFDAVIRSYLPVLEVARDLTMTVTPVLADQLEDAGARSGCASSCSSGGSAPPRPTSPRCRPSAGPPARRSSPATGRRWSCSTPPVATRCAPSAGRGRGRVALAASAATHAVLPLLATRAGLRLQLDAGIRSHRRRFGWDGGFWLPECAYAPGLEWRLAEHGVRWFCVDQSAHEAPLEALAPVATEAGPVALPIDWEAIGWLWSLDGYPSDPAHAQFDGKSLRGVRIWRIGGGAYDPAAGAAAARRQAGEFLAAIAARLRELLRARAAAAACSSSRSTPSCSATGGRRGRSGCEAVLAGAAAAGVRLVTSRRRSPSTSRSSAPAARLQLGGGEGPAHLGLARRSPTSPGPRGGWSCACCGRSPPACAGAAALRAARELLAVQASDWAFLDRRGPGGRLPLPARHRPRRGDAGGHRLRIRHRSAHAFACPGPEPRAAAGALAPADDQSPDPLLGVPAADRGRPRPPRPQALRGTGRAAESRSTC